MTNNNALAEAVELHRNFEASLESARHMAVAIAEQVGVAGAEDMPLANLLDKMSGRVRALGESRAKAFEVIVEAADYTDDPWPEADSQEMSVALRVKAMRDLCDEYVTVNGTTLHNYRRLEAAVAGVAVALEPVARNSEGTAHHVAQAVIDALKAAVAESGVEANKRQLAGAAPRTARSMNAGLDEAAKSWPPTAADEGDVWADRLGREWTVIAQDGMTLLERDETETPDPRDSVVCEPDWVEATYGPMTFLRGHDTTTTGPEGGSDS